MFSFSKYFIFKCRLWISKSISKYICVKKFNYTKIWGLNFTFHENVSQLVFYFSSDKSLTLGKKSTLALELQIYNFINIFLIWIYFSFKGNVYLNVSFNSINQFFWKYILKFDYFNENILNSDYFWIEFS